MLNSLIRKTRQLATDPTLRRWLMARALGATPGEPAFTAHCPPYLKDLPPLASEMIAPPIAFGELKCQRPNSPINVPLPGRFMELAPENAETLFTQRHDDEEILFAIHRFAWLPLLGDDADPAWVQTLWSIWRKHYGTPADGPAWRPYTAAERAVNILDFGRRHGLPEPVEDTLAVLAAHGPAIADRLEYFGDHHTSNHLSNNGRGLYLLGLALGLEACAERGARILLEEAKRIFHASGILREGSSHYHLLLTRNYADAWLAARLHQRPEEALLKKITGAALSVISHLVLPGGMPLIGDISPDCPPAFLSGLIAGKDGWISLLDEESKEVLVNLRESCLGAFTADLQSAGWLKAGFGPWNGLWHAAPSGWPFMPGHGHQDCGGFELHYQNEPLFIDPGRGAYGETDEAALYRSARAHNALLVDDQDPYPPNKPFYDDCFRRRIGGPSPELRRDADSVTLRHHGFARLGGVGALTRNWRFSDSAMTLGDRMDGDAVRNITRLFHTPLAAVKDGNSVILAGSAGRFKLSTDEAKPILRPATQWLAYGEGRPITVIEITNEAELPWSSAVTVEIL